MALKTPPPETPGIGADLRTDSSELPDIKLPVWVAGISTPGEGGKEKLETAPATPSVYTEGTSPKAPDADLAGKDNVITGLYAWMRDNAPDMTGVQPGEMGFLGFGANLLRMVNTANDMLARGLFEAGNIAKVASAETAGEPSMAELWPDGKSVDEVMGSLVNRANERVRDISKGPSKKV